MKPWRIRQGIECCRYLQWVVWPGGTIPACASRKARRRLEKYCREGDFTAEVSCVCNEMRRTGGFSPAQCVLGRGTRYGAGEHGDEEQAAMISSMQERVNPTTIFAERMAYRHETKKAFVHQNSSERVSRGLLRKAAPYVSDWQVGDIVSFR